MLDKLKMSSSLIGTPPPTRPVFPPWGTMPMRRSLHHLTTLLTSSVVRGLRTVVELPWYLFIQALLKGSSSDDGVALGDRVERMEVGGRNLAKWARSSSVTEFRPVRVAGECAHRRGGRMKALRTRWRARDMMRELITEGGGPEGTEESERAGVSQACVARDGRALTRSQPLRASASLQCAVAAVPCPCSGPLSLARLSLSSLSSPGPTQ